jgi:hypothetical protein
MLGFGTNPTNPFTNGVTGGYMFGANRNSPLFEFNGSRLFPTVAALQTVAPAYGTATVSGNPGYIDTLGSSNTVPPQNFYAYFSTNIGSGYDPNDVNFQETDGVGTAPICLQFFPTQPVGAPSLVSPSPNPYATWQTQATTPPPIGGSNLPFSNAQSYQILSAGLDGVYGVGGLYSPTSTTATLPTENIGITPGVYPFSNSNDQALRNVENDNITNFHNGKLN